MIAHLLMPLFFVLRLSGYAVGVTPWHAGAALHPCRSLSPVVFHVAFDPCRSWHAGAASVLMQVQWLIVAKL